MVDDRYNYSFHGVYFMVYKPTNITGSPILHDVFGSTAFPPPRRNSLLNSRAIRPCVDKGEAEIWSRYRGASPGVCKVIASKHGSYPLGYGKP